MRFIAAAWCALSVLAFGSVAAAQAQAKPAAGKPRAVKVIASTQSTITLSWRAPRRGHAVKYSVINGSKRLKSTKRRKAMVARLRCGERYRLRVVALGRRNARLGRSGLVTGRTSACVTASVASVAGDSAALARLLAQDMTLGSEALPHGLKTDFASKPRLSAGSNAGGYTGFTSWGQLYECASGNPQPAAQVEITSLEAWIKSRATGHWTRVRASNTAEGAAYAESYANDESHPADARSTGSSTLARAGGGYNFHFWPAGARVAINPADVADVITSVRARLFPGSYSSAEAQPCYVLSSGADYWSTTTATWDQLTTNKDVGIGRFKRVDSGWRVFTMSTTSAGELPAVAAGDGELR